MKKAIACFMLMAFLFIFIQTIIFNAKVYFLFGKIFFENLNQGLLWGSISFIFSKKICLSSYNR
jgi:hypothetical protein